MGYHPRIETSEISSHITSRTRDSALWFVNNQKLEDQVLGYVAKYTNKYQVNLYGLAIEGNHLHQTAQFPKANRYGYTRDLNSMTAKAVQEHYQGECPGGGVWHSRYSAEYMSHPEDIEKYFFYIALQPVNDGLVDRISDYPGYNFFSDAISGIKRTYKVLNKTKLYKLSRSGKKVNIKDCIDEYELEYARLPGYEGLSQQEYKKVMLEKLEHYRQEVLKERANRNKAGFLGKEKLQKIKPGSLPLKTKRTGRFGHRPRVLSVCNERRQAMKTWYFSIYYDFREASLKYRQGKSGVKFPPGTYKPPKFTCACTDKLDSIVQH